MDRPGTSRPVCSNAAADSVHGSAQHASSQAPLHEREVELEEKMHQLLKGNINEIYRCARYFCPSKQDAEDLAHEVCVRLLTTQPSLPTSIDKVKAYLRQCVKNAAISSGRIARSRSNKAESPIPEGDSSKLFGVDDRMEHVASRMDLRVAIRELDVEDQMLIYLRYYVGLSIKKAAREATGLTGGKAFRRHQAVLDRLRELLAEEAD
ncbi:sigma-70 family RNA polymerase sigma factor [Amycolatopsis sp. cmx-4-68]|uniref:sigma-70 family RNA polymerase sigma factor n=1 Tax=Amycolatopsis sp. cmx-4-68 TaxID=2790938 RepID=UPI00397E24AF